jgi:hypothetical protein
MKKIETIKKKKPHKEAHDKGVVAAFCTGFTTIFRIA